MAMATAASVVVANNNGGSHPGDENGECHLLGPFALIIQGSLGLLALLSLVFKRWRERPQRPLKIWAFDASKQVVGSMLLHIANLLMSMLSSGQLSVTLATVAGPGEYQANPCSFYLLNLAIDTTIGIPILIFLLRILTIAFSLTPLGEPPESIQSGNYGRPPKVTWWLKQSFIYFVGLLGMKFCVFIIFQLCPWIIRVGNWALRWTEDNEKLQVFFVMLFFPVVMNAIQYYIIDSFIKGQKPPDHDQIPSEEGEEDTVDESRRSNSQESGNESDHEVNKALEVEDKGSAMKLDEYDPTTDGEASGGSSGRGEPQDKSAPQQKEGTKGV